LRTLSKSGKAEQSASSRLANSAANSSVPLRIQWEAYRLRFPKLQLVRIDAKDDLSFLFAGNPDPELSLAYYESFWSAISVDTFGEAAQQLLKLFQQHPSTFQCSLWVSAAIGTLVAENEAVAKDFVKQYWKIRKKKIPAKTLAAHHALELVQGKNQLCWLSAIHWVRDFYRTKHLKYESDESFIQRAAAEYGLTRDNLRSDRMQKIRRCEGKILAAETASIPQQAGIKELAQAILSRDTVSDSEVRAIAATILDFPDRPEHELQDMALARLARTSLSTLTHARAALRRRPKPRPTKRQQKLQ